MSHVTLGMVMASTLNSEMNSRSIDASLKFTTNMFLKATLWAPVVPAIRVLFGPFSPNSVAILFLIIVICDPGSITALTGKVLVGVIIWQIKVSGKPRFLGMYCMVLRHLRPWISPKVGLISFVILGESNSHSCLGLGGATVGGVGFGSSFVFLFL